MISRPDISLQTEAKAENKRGLIMSELMKNLAKLYELQLIDNEIIEGLRRLRRLEDTDTETKRKFVEATESKNKVDEEMNPIKQRAAEIKDENTQYLEKKKNCEDRLFNADTDPRDLQYLQKEREQVINLMKKNEDELVRLMVQLDTSELKKNEFDEKIKELEPLYNKEMEERKSEIETLRARVQELKQQRQVFRSFEDKTLLAKYMDLQKSHDGVAIATVNDGVCDGCFVEVPKSTLQKIEDSAQIVTCQRCGRILYPSDHPFPKED